METAALVGAQNATNFETGPRRTADCIVIRDGLIDGDVCLSVCLPADRNITLVRSAQRPHCLLCDSFNETSGLKIATQLFLVRHIKKERSCTSTARGVHGETIALTVLTVT